MLNAPRPSQVRAAAREHGVLSGSLYRVVVDAQAADARASVANASATALQKGALKFAPAI